MKIHRLTFRSKRNRNGATCVAVPLYRVAGSKYRIHLDTVARIRVIPAGRLPVCLRIKSIRYGKLDRINIPLFHIAQRSII